MSYTAVPISESVRPHTSMRGVESTQGRRARAAAAVLAACIGAAAAVALIGGMWGEGRRGEGRAGELAVRGELELIPDYMHRQHERTVSDLAASAHTLMDTASGIMQDVRSHALKGDMQLPTGIKLASAPMQSGSDSEGTAKRMGGILSKIAVDPPHMGAPHQQLDDAPAAAPAEAAAAPAEGGAAPAAQGGETKPKVLGATGEKVFGGGNSTVVGFLGFSKKEPQFFGVPFPVLMITLVLILTCSCLTVGCIVARKTDILKVNVEPVGAPAQPQEEDLEDTKGYYWRQNK